MPRTATRSPGRAPLLRSELNVVRPAHINGAASAVDKSLGNNARAVVGCEHVLGVPAVKRDARDADSGLTGKEVAAAAGVAGAAVPGVPTDADMLTRHPARRDIFAHGVDYSDDFVPRHPGVLDSGKHAVLGDGVTMANATGFHLDADLARPRVGNRTLDEFQWTTGM